MVRLFLAVAIAVIPALLVSATDTPSVGGAFSRELRLVTPQPMPDLAFRELTADGTQRDWGFAELRGRVLVVTFWATWCPVCAKEMPKLDALQRKLADEGVLVVALSQDQAGIETARRYLERKGLPNLRVFHDPGRALAGVLGVDGVPTSFVVDKQGRMVGVAQGPASWSSPEALALLRFYAHPPEKPSAG